MGMFVPRTPENLVKSNQEIYEKQSDEVKELVKESGHILKNNPHELITDFYVEHFEAMYHLLGRVEEIIEDKFKKLGK